MIKSVILDTKYDSLKIEKCDELRGFAYEKNAVE